jgi:hypothetical protein
MAFWTMPLPGLLRKTATGAPIAFIAHTVAVTSPVADITINKPAGAQVGDLLVMFILEGSGGNAASATGWSPVISDAQLPHFFALSRTVDGSEGANFTFTTPGASKRGIMILLRGGAGAVDVAGTPARATGTLNGTAASISAAHAGVLISFFGIAGANKTVASAPSGMTNVAVENTSIALTIALYKLEGSPIGATGAKAITFTPAAGANTVAVSIQFY